MTGKFAYNEVADENTLYKTLNGTACRTRTGSQASTEDPRLVVESVAVAKRGWRCTHWLTTQNG